MALQTSINRRNRKDNNDDETDDENHVDEDDEEIDETEGNLIENYHYLTRHCGLLRQSPTTGVLSAIQKQQEKQRNQSVFTRQNSSRGGKRPDNKEFEHSFSSSTKQWCSPMNDLNNNNNNNHTYSTTTSRVPPTIYYNDNENDTFDHNRSFNLVKLFARMKARLKHDKRYRPEPTHQLLYEEDPQEWYELTKNVRTVLTKALLPDGGYDAHIKRSKMNNSRQGSYKKASEHRPVLPKDQDDDDKIHVDIDEELNTEGDPEYDEIIWQKFLTCSRGIDYRRAGICKAIDRQQFQGQLVYFYGVANNILIDENLRASGLS